MRKKRIVVEVNGDNVGQLYRNLRLVAKQIASGETGGVMNDGADGEYEYHIYDLEGGGGT